MFPKDKLDKITILKKKSFNNFYKWKDIVW